MSDNASRSLNLTLICMGHKDMSSFPRLWDGVTAVRISVKPGYLQSIDGIETRLPPSLISLYVKWLPLSTSSLSQLCLARFASTLTSLSIGTCKGLESLDGLQRCSALCSLSLNWGKFEDISALASCRNLTSVILQNCSLVSDISPLQGRPKIEVLDVRGTAVRSLLPLVTLSNMKSLNCSMESWHPAVFGRGRNASLRRIFDRLVVFGFSGVMDKKLLRYIRSSPRLKCLDLLSVSESCCFSQGISTSSPLSPSCLLRVDMGVTTTMSNDSARSLIAFIQHLPSSVVALSFYTSKTIIGWMEDELNNEFVESAFAPSTLQMNAVRVFHGSVSCGITNINPIVNAFSSTLEYFSLQHTAVEDISVLQKCRLLLGVDLHNSVNLSDISPLCGASSLKYLDLSNTDVQDVLPLKSCSSLKYLNIGNDGSDSQDSPSLQQLVEHLPSLGELGGSFPVPDITGTEDLLVEYSIQ